MFRSYFRGSRNALACNAAPWLAMYLDITVKSILTGEPLIGNRNKGCEARPNRAICCRRGLWQNKQLANYGVILGPLDIIWSGVEDKGGSFLPRLPSLNFTMRRARPIATTFLFSPRLVSLFTPSYRLLVGLLYNLEMEAQHPRRLVDNSSTQVTRSICSLLIFLAFPSFYIRSTRFLDWISFTCNTFISN